MFQEVPNISLLSQKTIARNLQERVEAKICIDEISYGIVKPNSRKKKMTVNGVTDRINAINKKKQKKSKKVVKINQSTINFAKL